MWIFNAILVAAFFHASVSQYNYEYAEEPSSFGNEEVERDDDNVIVFINDEPESNDAWEPDGPLQARSPTPEYLDMPPPPPEYFDVEGPPYDYV